jgi:hypothetical protein
MNINFNVPEAAKEITNSRGTPAYRAIFNKLCSTLTISQYDYEKELSGDEFLSFIEKDYEIEKVATGRLEKDGSTDFFGINVRLLGLPYDIIVGVDCFGVDVCYDSNQEGAEDFAIGLARNIQENLFGAPKTTEKKISIVTSNGVCLGTETFTIKDQGVELDDNYNQDLIDVYPRLNTFLNSSESGLVLMHGPVGTGKTSYIRKIISDSKKQCIYVPKDLFSSIAMPSFTGFLSTVTDSVIILEDSEDLLCPRSGVRSSVVSELLNFTDGLLSDMFKLKFICTCNSELSGVDEALMRPGRLVADLYFGPLETSKVNNLYKKLGIDKTVTKPTHLSEIYCSTKTLLLAAKKERKMGF